jgi:hypothetical protein
MFIDTPAIRIGREEMIRIFRGKEKPGFLCSTGCPYNLPLPLPSVKVCKGTHVKEYYVILQKANEVGLA